jgi:hypothetical protein
MTQATKAFWQKTQQPHKFQLPKELDKHLESKFLDMYGCVLLDSMIPSYLLCENSTKQSSFEDLPAAIREDVRDRTGLEHFVSKIHIDSYVNSHHFECGLQFLLGILKLFRSQYPQNVLRGILSMDDGSEPDGIFSCCVSYNLKRVDESWLAPNIDDANIDQFREILLVIDSVDPKLDGC